MPAWSYELAAVLDVLNVLLAEGAEVGVLEEKITEVRYLIIFSQILILSYSPFSS